MNEIQELKDVIKELKKDLEIQKKLGIKVSDIGKRIKRVEEKLEKL